MAAVRITKDLVWEVKNNIDKIYAPRLATIDKDNPITIPASVYEDAYALIVPAEAQETMKLLPKNYFSHVSAFKIAFLCESLTVTGREVPVPETHSTYTSLQVPRTPKWQWFWEPVDKRKEQRDAILAERTAATDAAGTMLGNYATLAPALKAWPALWNLLNEEIKTRHRTPVTPREKAAPREIVEVDISGVTALVTMEKIKGNL